MRSAPRVLALSLTALAVLLLARLGLAQGLPADGDPFSGVSAADSAHMSAINGVPGANGLADGAGAGTGAKCGSGCDGAQVTEIGAPATQQITYGNSYTVNVSASNHQTTVVGPGLINTSGGLNSAGGGNAGSGN
jgi:hypothetical protein